MNNDERDPLIRQRLRRLGSQLLDTQTDLSESPSYTQSPGRPRSARSARHVAVPMAIFVLVLGAVVVSRSGIASNQKSQAGSFSGPRESTKTQVDQRGVGLMLRTTYASDNKLTGTATLTNGSPTRIVVLLGCATTISAFRPMASGWTDGLTPEAQTLAKVFYGKIEGQFLSQDGSTPKFCPEFGGVQILQPGEQYEFGGWVMYPDRPGIIRVRAFVTYADTSEGDTKQRTMVAEADLGSEDSSTSSTLTPGGPQEEALAMIAVLHDQKVAAFLPKLPPPVEAYCTWTSLPGGKGQLTLSGPYQEPPLGTPPRSPSGDVEQRVVVDLRSREIISSTLP